MVDDKVAQKLFEEVMNSTSTYNYSITVAEKNIVLMFCGKLLKEAEEEGDANCEAAMALATLAEKVLTTCEEEDLQLTVKEKVAIHSLNMLANAIASGKKPADIVKELQDEAKRK